MLTHIVLFRLHDRRPENVLHAQATLDTLSGHVPTLRALEVGRDILHTGRSYDLALIARFDDRAGLEVYQAHPVHLPVLVAMRELCDSIVAVDFES